MNRVGVERGLKLGQGAVSRIKIRGKRRSLQEDTSEGKVNELCKVA